MTGCHTGKEQIVVWSAERSQLDGQRLGNSAWGIQRNHDWIWWGSHWVKSIWNRKFLWVNFCHYCWLWFVIQPSVQSGPISPKTTYGCYYIIIAPLEILNLFYFEALSFLVIVPLLHSSQLLSVVQGSFGGRDRWRAGWWWQSWHHTWWRGCWGSWEYRKTEGNEKVGVLQSVPVERYILHVPGYYARSNVTSFCRDLGTCYKATPHAVPEGFNCTATRPRRNPEVASKKEPRGIVWHCGKDSGSDVVPKSLQSYADLTAMLPSSPCGNYTTGRRLHADQQSLSLWYTLGWQLWMVRDASQAYFAIGGISAAIITAENLVMAEGGPGELGTCLRDLAFHDESFAREIMIYLKRANYNLDSEHTAEAIQAMSKFTNGSSSTKEVLESSFGHLAHIVSKHSTNKSIAYSSVWMYLTASASLKSSGMAQYLCCWKCCIFIVQFFGVVIKLIWE